MRASSFLIVCCSFISGVANADILRPNASCASVVEVMDSSDRQQIGYAVQLIADALAEADRPFVKAKRGSVVAPLSDDRLTTIVALVIGRCRAGKNATARKAAESTYTGLRSMQLALGMVR